MRGRRAELKAIKGGLADVPPPTEHVPADMADEWTTVAADLQLRGLLTASMIGVLESYILARWMAREAAAALAAHGMLVKSAHGVPKPNPAAGIMNKAQDTVARLAAEMGLTPASRSRKSLQKHERDDADEAPAGLDL